MSALLQVSGLGIKFGGLVALKGFDIKVLKGSIVGLIGPNGAGKTTAFNLITGVYKPSFGEIVLEGRPIQRLPPHRLSQIGISRTFQNIRLFANMTVLENVLAASVFLQKGTFWSSIFGLTSAKHAKSTRERDAMELLEFVGLSNQASALATSLSYGSQRKLEIARALMTKPKILLLDEPAAGMNPSEKESLRVLVELIAKKDIGVLVIEHDMKFVMNLCSHVTVLDHGEIISSGLPEYVQKDPKVVEAYLGPEGD